MDDHSRWELVARQLAHHIKPGKDRDWVAALNRIFREVLARKGIGGAPLLGPETCSIGSAEYPRAELALTQRHHDEKIPRHDSGPPVLVRFRGRDYAVDGTNRINKRLADGMATLCSVIILFPGQ